MIVLITGASSGFGAEMARKFASHGHSVIAAARRTDRLSALASELGKNLLPVELDVTNKSSIDHALASLPADWQAIDVLINNAGIQHVAPVDEVPVEKWDAILAINLSSVFHATRATLPHMKAAKWGRVINIASAHGLVASPYKSAYVAAKHGVVGFTKSCALEVAEQGITVNAICPGYVLTPLVEKQIDDQAKVHGIPRENVIRDILLAPQPNKRFAEIDEVASLALYLASNAAQGITGSSMSIDGGWTAR